MKKSLIALAVAGAIATTAGCTATDYIANGVKSYCGLSEEVRAVNREAVALAVQPHKITVDCQ